MGVFAGFVLAIGLCNCLVTFSAPPQGERYCSNHGITLAEIDSVDRGLELFNH